MRTQNREHYCPSCGTIIHGNEKYCPECGRVQRNSSHRGKYLNSSKKHGKEGAIILILGILVLVLGISTLVFFFKAQEPADISLQETADVSDPIITETTVGTTEKPTEQSQATTEEATESPTEFTEYILETTPTQVATEATNPEEMTGTVLRSAGELNVRSGAGTNYSSIGRLYGGDTVTIYEQKDVNGTRWGNIGYGWVSMDYIAFGVDNSTDPEYDNTRGDKLSEFNGEWISTDGYWYMRITPSGSGVDIYAEYPYNTSEKSVWTMHGEYDEYTVIRYWNGICKDYNNGNETVKYTNGEGAVNFCEAGIEWHDFIKGGYTTLERIGTHVIQPGNPNNGGSNNNQDAGQSNIPQSPPLYKNSTIENATDQNEYYNYDNTEQVFYRKYSEEILRAIRRYVYDRAGVPVEEDRVFNVTITYLWWSSNRLEVQAHGALDGRRFLFTAKFYEDIYNGGIKMDSMEGTSFGWE